MADNSDSRPLGELLVDLERVLREKGVPVVEHLAPGLPPERVRGTLTGLGLDPHPDLVTWWSWHDGARTDQVPFASPRTFPVVGWANRATLCVDTCDGALLLADPHDFDPPLSPTWTSLGAWITDLTNLWTSGVVAFTPNGTEVDKSRWPDGVTRESHW